MAKKENSGTTRRGFVKKVAAGSAVAAVAGGLTTGCSQSGKSAESLESKIAALEKRLQHVEDIQAIQRLQYAYNYYVEHMMKQEIIDCFSDSPDVLLDWLEGKWKGKAGVRKYFDVSQIPPIGFQHQLIPSAGLITVAPDGNTAKGRWYAFGGVMMPIPAKEGEKPSFSRSFINGIYEIGYIKEDGIWKMLSINWVIPYGVRIKDGWILPEDIAGPMLSSKSGAPGPKIVPDIPMDKNDLRYVTGYVFPYHFKHPVTGKPSSEATRNARLKPLKV
ncbi:MAG TPA: nuclear transport factor 2 family protein [Acidobacteriota bacterium]|nr:nuclear transport factor 2 family protein [Acidobacteriota bacterium]